jgi:two-component system response regulator FixJ
MEHIVYIADADTVGRRALAILLRERGYATHAFVSAADLIDALSYIAPGCVLLDLHLTDVDPFETLAILIERRPELPVIAMATAPDIRLAVRAIKSGAADVIEKPVATDLLLSMLEQGFETLPARTSEERRSREATSRLSDLTLREREVLDGLLDGCSSRQVAERLGISSRTAEMHRGRLMRKLGTRSMAEVTRMAFAAGLIDRAA